MLLVVSRLRWHRVHERLGGQHAFARFDEERIGSRKHRSYDGRMCGDNRLVAQRIEPVDQTLLLGGLNMQLRLLDGEHEGLTRFGARLSELHEQEQTL